MYARPSVTVSIPEDDDSDLRLPAAWTPAPRPPLPIVASLMPIVGGVVLWLITGSLIALALAALGPLIAVAAVADARRAARRDRRRAEREADRARERVAELVAERHETERAALWRRHPDVAGLLEDDTDIWKAWAGGEASLVLGAGDVTSAVRVTGGEGDARARALRADARVLRGGPVRVPLGTGIVVVGTGVAAEGAHRALVLAHCLASAPRELHVSADDGAGWARDLPHAACGAPRTIAVSTTADLPVPAGDVTIALRAPGDASPPGCAATLTVHGPADAHLRIDGDETPVAVESIGAHQAALIARALAARAETTLGLAPEPVGPVFLADLADAAPRPVRGGLPAAFVREGTHPWAIDLVADGPHAVVAGVTGSGKSELLISWILALATTHSPHEVTFLLADFKGGTAFDAFAHLPHVTGVLTDLDRGGARRAIESLRAEVRWREGELARVGARDVLDPRTELPRLVIVVDEFAALLGDHPELHAVFSDVAARGRALGMHLVLGTQRVSGVVRDSLLANCPLRISLRVTDPSDSRAVIGTDDAAMLAGDVGSRGQAMVKRAADAEPRRVRVALSTPADVDRAVHRGAGAVARRPWLPDLGADVALDALTPRAAPGVLVLGLGDEPEHQRQEPVGVRTGDRGILVVGAAGSGRTTALRTLAAQAPGGSVWIGGDPERAWDAVTALATTPPPAGAVVAVDDLDAVTAVLPHDHAAAFLDRLEHLVRSAGDGGYLVAISVQRIAGPSARLVELLPRRLILACASRAEHIAAGGDPAHFAPDAPAGRGRWGSVAVQVAHTSPDVSAPESAPRPWSPTAALTGLVARRTGAVTRVLEEWAGRGIHVVGIDAYLADPAIVAEGTTVVVGDPEHWQANWRLLSAMRSDHDLVIDSGCAADFRVLTGSRDVPPYARTAAGRAWLVSRGDAAVRIVLP
jgi:S-DNA-T family DNA segregation ATPase FtsK/SpoIIIE